MARGRCTTPADYTQAHIHTAACRGETHLSLAKVAQQLLAIRLIE